MIKRAWPLLLAVCLLLAACGGSPAGSSSAAPSSAAPQGESVAASAPAATATPAPTPEPTPSPALEFEMTAPKGFFEQEQEDLEGTGITRSWWHEDGGNISLTVGDAVGTFGVIDGEMLRESVEEVMVAVMGDGVKVTLEDFSRGTLAGQPMYRCDLSITVDALELDMQRIMIGFESDRTYSWQFNDITGKHAEEFEDCIKSFSITEVPPDASEDGPDTTATPGPSATPAD